ncbi:hypothetical protein B0181_00235 [Moraxella caviae]|uniref:EcsC protein family n=1 Tax=Moraxella caviae TaxID=34060 RepID=A0A1T0ACX1_9GAMM|nr:EcsC family protein [Moraxella caviae]OOR93518.1 hypothetical protein B0181_00235 [Moraxella caviae]STZ10338.1 EcsC protein family [Moraxella caviae]VEW10432.1 EcsC protein family [Moraxella caviae]
MTQNETASNNVNDAADDPKGQRDLAQAGVFTSSKPPKLKATLSKLGAYLGDLYTSSRTKDAHAYQAVDLSQSQFGEDAFHRQGSQMAGRLFGGKIAKVQKLAGKVVPASAFESLSNALFDKLAAWASAWAAKDLSKDIRLAKLGALTDKERDDFAYDIANQNRALAVVGGVAGLAGLKGVVADSAWLLMVSLKSVYQLAMIYDMPLTGKDGVRLAYGVLSGANLEKLQEKQVLMTALALGNSMLLSAKQTDLRTEIGKMGANHLAAQPYTEQLLQLADYVDLDKFNSSWLNKLLPLASVAVGAHYNGQLIDEVLGTAMATFRHERPKLLSAPAPVQ